MEHAGFDKLHSPFGAFMVCAGLLIITAIIIFGSSMVKVAMKREKEVRDRMREAHQERKNQ